MSSNVIESMNILKVWREFQETRSDEWKKHNDFVQNNWKKKKSAKRQEKVKKSKCEKSLERKNEEHDSRKKI